MKKIFSCMLISTVVTVAMAGTLQKKVFIYAPNDKAGLHLAYMSPDGQWTDVGQLCASDYSRWGSEKRMYSPFVMRAADHTWRAVWQLNDYAPCFAAAYSADLVTWRPQDYPRVSVKGCLNPMIITCGDSLRVIFATKDHQWRYVGASQDFRSFTPDDVYQETVPAVKTDTVKVGGRPFAGQSFTISKTELDNILHYFDARMKESAANNEVMTEDQERLMPLLGKEGSKSVEATLAITPSDKKAISDKLIGVFFEDISYAADGGLYAEMVQNRDFEYTAKDHQGWNATTAWTSSQPILIDDSQPLSGNNPHYAVLSADTLYNDGWDGIAVRQGAKYDFSFYARNIDTKKKTFTVSLVGGDGKPLAQSTIKTQGASWTRYAVTLVPASTVSDARLKVVAMKKGKAAVDMISLFPEDTYCGRKNGLRKDLAETIAALHPKFVRFPGGCMSHGDGIDNIYHWNHTVGELYDRKPDSNIWNYHQTRGLGFYEYFQFCEDMGAEPLPVLAAGVPCQNSGADKDGFGGQQGGIPMAEMPAYCQEILNMIEWANGNPATSKWAKMRADAGHPAPFHLKYIGIGNEDIISTVFEQRFLMIVKAIKARYPEIKVCGTVGPFHYPSSDYIEGWKFAKENKSLIDMVDEHYYESTGWFMNHQDYYDGYDRQGPKVYLGEYAANSRPKASNVEAALAEAMHLCHVERNADVVAMTSYAPLLSKDKHQNWHPDMIYFDNTSIRTSPSYETQRLFSVYSGDTYLSSVIKADSIVAHRLAASVVTDSKTGCRYIRLVNALPVSTDLNIEGMEMGGNVEYVGYEGSPRDTKEKKVKGVYPFGEGKYMVSLPPYSVRILIINNNK